MEVDASVLLVLLTPEVHQCFAMTALLFFISMTLEQATYRM